MSLSKVVNLGAGFDWSTKMQLVGTPQLLAASTATPLVS